MIKKITEALIGGESVDKLHSNSQDILDIFTKTVDGLQAVNTRLDTHAAEKEAAKKKLEEDLSKFNSLKEKNQKVIAKIGKIFE